MCFHPTEIFCIASGRLSDAEELAAGFSLGTPSVAIYDCQERKAGLPVCPAGMADISKTGFHINDAACLKVVECCRGEFDERTAAYAICEAKKRLGCFPP